LELAMAISQCNAKEEDMFSVTSFSSITFLELAMAISQCNAEEEDRFNVTSLT
jgi:hypothetical protein